MNELAEGARIADRLRRGENVVTYTKGTSMQPLLYEGRTYVVLSPLKGTPRRGSLPVYTLPDGRYVLHRLIKCRNGVCVTRGDNRIASEHVALDRMVGEVIEIYRNGRIIKTSDFGYELYSHIWMLIYPLRRLYKQARRAASIVKRQLKKCLKKRS